MSENRKPKQITPLAHLALKRVKSGRYYYDVAYQEERDYIKNLSGAALLEYIEEREREEFLKNL